MNNFPSGAFRPAFSPFSSSHPPHTHIQYAMSSPQNATVAAPRRGKFLSAPVPSSQTSAAPNAPPPPLQTRGKFLGKVPASSASNLQAASIGTSQGDADHDSIDKLKAFVHSSKIAAASRRKSIASQRQLVMNDLEAAENIVLSLLDIASDVAGTLSKMTTAKSKKRHREKRTDKVGNAEDSFEDLTAKVRSNGAGYLEGVKRLHKLLAPHSSYVKSLNTHDREEDTVRERSVLKSLDSPNSTFSKIVEEATSNMHAVRVKKRLAIERCEILKEMIRSMKVEECGLSYEGERGEEESHINDTAGSKRKHDSIRN